MRQKTYSVPTGQIAGLHFGDPAAPPQLILLHANGFNARSYRTLLEPLGVPCLALDLRGQGQSVGFDLKPDKLKSFQIFADDVSHVLREYITQPVLMVGHSLGGVVGMLAARDTPNKVRGYLGFDPVTVPGIIRALPYIPGGPYFLKNSFDWAKAAGRRRAGFDNFEAAYAHYSGRGTFKFLSDDVVRDYLQGGTITKGAGICLSCDPLWEQAVYGAQANDIFGAAKALPDNTRIIYAGKKPASMRGTRAKMARVLGRKSKMEYHKDLSHFFPLIRQDMTRDYLKAALKA